MKLLKFILINCLLIISVYANEISELFFKGVEAYEQGKYKKSIKIFKKILKNYPNASDLGKVQAQIGFAYEKLEKYKKAFKAYENIFSNYPEYEYLEEIVEKEYLIAKKYSSGEMKSIFGFDFAESDSTALKIYDRVIKNFPFGKYAKDAFIESIKLYIKTKKYDDASTKIRLFKGAYIDSPLLDDIHFYDAENSYKQIYRSDFDQTNTNNAIEKCKTYLEEFSDGKYKNKVISMMEELKEIICEQKFKTAEFYSKKGNLEAAQKYFKEIVKLFPESTWARLATQRLSN